MLFKHLTCFVAVVDNGGFTRAAERLYITQSAVSQQIAALEAEAGTRLIYRSGRRIELTESGRYLYREVKPLLGQLESALGKSRDVPTCNEQRLTLYYRGDGVDPLVVPILASLRERHPSLKVTLLRSKRTKDTLASVELGEVDLALLKKGSHPLAAKLQFQSLCRSHLTCAVPEGHPLSGRRSVDDDDLSSERLILLEKRSDPLAAQPARDAFRYQWVHEKLKKRYPDSYVLAVDNITAVTMAKAGFGVALVDSSQISCGAGLSFVPYRQNHFFEYGAFFSKSSANPFVQDFIDTARSIWRGNIMFGPCGKTCTVERFCQLHPDVEDGHLPSEA